MCLAVCFVDTIAGASHDNLGIGKVSYSISWTTVSIISVFSLIQNETSLLVQDRYIGRYLTLQSCVWSSKVSLFYVPAVPISKSMVAGASRSMMMFRIRLGGMRRRTEGGSVLIALSLLNRQGC